MKNPKQPDSSCPVGGNGLQKPLRFDIREFAAELCDLLIQEGVQFQSDGFPIIPEECRLREIPRDVLMYPCSKASQTPEKDRTILCCNERERDLIGHLRKLDERIESWRGCLAFCGFDLSPCANRPAIEQEQNMWINALVTAHVAAMGIPVIQNFRSGGPKTLRFLCNEPQGFPVAIGAHGSSRSVSRLDLAMLRIKIGILRPSLALVYGPVHPACMSILAEAGVPVRRFPDYRSICRAGHGKAA